MGQYWLPVNLDKREFIHPHTLGAGLKLVEQLSAHPGPGAALIILCAAMPEAQGGGDFDLKENWHGSERTDMSKVGPMPEDYPALAASVIGRWAGDRIALIGDYAKDSDLPPEFDASEIYHRCRSDAEEVDFPYTDISLLVAAVIEHELGGRYTGERWRRFE